jgi:hypothetical protein
VRGAVRCVADVDDANVADGIVVVERVRAVRDPFPVVRPTREACADLVGRDGHRRCLTVGRTDPHASVVAVVFRVDPLNGVRDPSTVGRQARIGSGSEQADVFGKQSEHRRTLPTTRGPHTATGVAATALL